MPGRYGDDSIGIEMVSGNGRTAAAAAICGTSMKDS
jgi:hypothetical protein